MRNFLYVRSQDYLSYSKSLLRETVRPSASRCKLIYISLAVFRFSFLCLNMFFSGTDSGAERRFVSLVVWLLMNSRKASSGSPPSRWRLEYVSVPALYAEKSLTTSKALLASSNWSSAALMLLISSGELARIFISCVSDIDSIAKRSGISCSLLICFSICNKFSWVLCRFFCCGLSFNTLYDSQTSALVSV